MRTISGTLLAAQRGASADPYDRIYLLSADTLTSYTFTTADSPNRIVGIQHREECYGGVASIVLDNSDGYFNALNLKGYKVTLGWGYAGEYSNAPDLWVIGQVDKSVEGKVRTQLLCYDRWNMWNKSHVFAGGVKLTGTVTRATTGDPFRMKLTGQTSGAVGRVTHYDISGGYINVSGVTGTFSVGETAKTADNSLTIVISQVTVIGATAGGAASWKNDTVIKDIVSSLISDWCSVTVDSDDGSSNFQTYKPTYSVEIGITIRSVVKEMFDFTECAGRIGSDGNLHILYLNPAPASPDYSYALDTGTPLHSFLEEARDRRLVTPNRIFTMNFDPWVATPTFVGTSTDTDSYAQLGKYLSQVVVMPSIGSQADADARASALINRAKASANTGEILVPMMNVGQELLDWVQITDNRSGDLVVSGRIGTIQRNFAAGQHSMTIILGNLETSADIDSSGEVIPAGSDVPAAESGTTPETLIPFNFAPAILPIVSNVVFTSSAKNAVSWAAGTDVIKFATGAMQSVVAGSVTGMTLKTWVYGTVGSTTLQTTTVFTDCVGANKFIVAILKPAATGDKALIVQGRDDVVAGQLSAIAADIGLVTAGEIRVGTGTLGSNYTGWRLWVESSIGRFAGYQNNVIQYYSGSDGILYAGGGYVKLSAAGLNIDTSGGAIGRVNLRYGTSGSAHYITVDSLSRMNIFNGQYYLLWSGYTFAPGIADYIDLGSTTLYYDRVFASTYYGKNTTIQSFQCHDDIKLVKAIKSKKMRDKKDGKERDVIDVDSLPEEAKLIKVNPETGEKEVFINMGSLSSLALGAIRQLSERVEKLERKEVNYVSR